MYIITERALYDDGLPKTDLEYKLQITCARTILFIGGVGKYK